MKNIIVRLAVLGLVLTACGGGGAVVATVNGAEITSEDVEALYSEGLGAVPAEQFAENLRNTIVEFIVIQEAEGRFGITFTPEEIEARVAELRTQIEAQIESQGQELTYEEFLAEQGFTEDRIYRIAHQQLVADAVETALLADAGPITDDELADRYDAALMDLTEACVSHILVETEEEALDAKARIEAGESFADVAMELGTDGTAANGGELGCSALSQYVPEFALGAYDVPLNETSQPVRSQFGYHLIFVTERTTTPIEAAEADLRAAAEIERSGRLVQDWLLEIVTAAEVTIDEEYGTWVTDPFPTVQPPA